MHEYIKFALEEEDNVTHFLDLTLTKNNHKLEYNIYRKPTTTNQNIHSTSHHP